MRRKAADEVQMMMITTSPEGRPVRVTAEVRDYVNSMRSIEAMGETRLMADGAQAGRPLSERIARRLNLSAPTEEGGDRA